MKRRPRPGLGRRMAEGVGTLVYSASGSSLSNEVDEPLFGGDAVAFRSAGVRLIGVSPATFGADWNGVLHVTTRGSDLCVAPNASAACHF